MLDISRELSHVDDATAGVAPVNWQGPDHEPSEDGSFSFAVGLPTSMATLSWIGNKCYRDTPSGCSGQ
jgi:hypothetical protein